MAELRSTDFDNASLTAKESKQSRELTLRHSLKNTHVPYFYRFTSVCLHFLFPHILRFSIVVLKG